METITFFVSLKVEITHSYNFLEVDFIFLSNWRIYLHHDHDGSAITIHMNLDCDCDRSSHILKDGYLHNTK